MSKEKVEVHPQVVREEVPRIVIPKGLSFRNAAKYCSAKADEEDADAQFSREFNCLPWPGAYATETLLMREYSAVAADSKEIEVPARGGTKKIRWGRWDIAGLGSLYEQANDGERSLTYRVIIVCKRKFEAKAHQLFQELEAEIQKRELYAGAALMLKPNDKGKLWLEAPPPVIELRNVGEDDLILPTELARCVKAELFQVIKEAPKLAKKGIPTRRGYLLAGRPGTGKTMSCEIAAKLATDRDWAVFYLPDARAIEAALTIAEMYAPAALIVEDIDRQLSGERTALTDRILNALSGLSSRAQVVFIATTNDASKLPAPLLRPGRFDSYFTFDLPDEHAAEALLRMYLGASAPSSLNGAGHACAGLLPASIREVASRSKLHAAAEGRDTPDPEEIQVAAMSVRKQQEKLEEAEALGRPEPPEVRVMLRKDGQTKAEADAEAAASLVGSSVAIAGRKHTVSIERN